MCSWGPKVFSDGTPPEFDDDYYGVMFDGRGCPNKSSPVDGIGGGLPQNFCTADLCVAVTHSGGDPHFIGFNQKLFTYQGECTLIVLDSPAATAAGDDVTIHVRTTRRLDFSYISGVAMKIGDDVVEVKPNADMTLNDIIITGDKVTMSGLPFILTREEKGTRKMIVSYSFDISNGF